MHFEATYLDQIERAISDNDLNRTVFLIIKNNIYLISQLYDFIL